MPGAFVCPQCGCAEEVACDPGVCARCSAANTSKPRTFIDRLIDTSAMVLLLLVAVALLWPAMGTAKEAAKRATCKSNLKHIGLALLNYHVRYGSYPPAYIADENGRPMHSWRVLILPFLEHYDLYAQYDFNQPWDSKHNLQLASQMPAEFHCPGARQKRTDKTSYVAANGPGYFFDGDDCRRESHVRDGLSNSIAVLDDVRRELVWLDPSDGVTAVDPNVKVDGDAHPGRIVALFADGSVRSITSDVTPKDFAKQLTISGGESAGDGMH